MLPPWALVAIIGVLVYALASPLIGGIMLVIALILLLAGLVH